MNSHQYPDDRRYMSHEQRAADDPRYRRPVDASPSPAFLAERAKAFAAARRARRLHGIDSPEYIAAAEHAEMYR